MVGRQGWGGRLRLQRVSRPAPVFRLRLAAMWAPKADWQPGCGQYCPHSAWFFIIFDFFDFGGPQGDENRLAVCAELQLRYAPVPAEPRLIDLRRTMGRAGCGRKYGSHEPDSYGPR